MTFEQAFVVSRANHLSEFLEKARALFARATDEELRSSNDLYILERFFQIVVDDALDINHHFIKELKLPTPDDLQSTFKILAENKILSPDFAEKFAPVVGLRNRVVHQYEKVDPVVFLENFRANITDFDIYLKHILEFLKRQKTS